MNRRELFATFALSPFIAVNVIAKSKIDSYTTGNYMTVGYNKYSNGFDAGLFYCPYVPLQMVRNENSIRTYLEPFED